MRQRELEAKAKKLRQQLSNTNAQLNHIKAKKTLPALKKKYEGKYFKYRNNYSLPETEADYWFIYFHVTDVNGASDMKAISFETTKDGNIEIQIEKDFRPYDSMIEIDKSEYEKALEDLKINLIKVLG